MSLRPEDGKEGGGSGVSGEEKYKKLKDGTTNRYIYYGCTRGKDKHCKNIYIREEELIQELLKIINQVEIDRQFFLV